MRAGPRGRGARRAKTSGDVLEVRLGRGPGSSRSRSVVRRSRSVVSSVADDAVRDVRVGGLAQQVAAEEQARRDPALLEVARRARCASNGASGRTVIGEAEPARVASSASPRAGRASSSSGASAVAQAARGCARRARDEVVEPVELGDADRGLHVGRLQVVAEVRVDVLVVVAVRAASPSCWSKRLPQVFVACPGSHQQSRPQSRNDSTMRLQLRPVA